MMRFLSHLAVRWLLLLGWMVIIFAFSAQPHSGEITQHYLGALNVPIRKFGHVTEYGILFTLAYNAFRRGGLPAFLFSLIYACSDEWHQSFIPGRTATIYDVAVDSVGMLIAWGLIVVIRSRLPRSSP
ncbi:MAG TPA: VanZ family protein [Candidatus Obscuribacterales bacterium]